MPRFFVEPSAVYEDRIVLTGDNAHHAAYSLRLAPGDRIKVCDQQNAYLCEMVCFDSETATARILSASPIDTEPPFIARLYQALPKGDKLDTVIQKAVECGAWEIVPFESERCVVRVKPEAEARKTERRQKIAAEAAKQCGRSLLPSVQPTVSFEQMLALASESDVGLFCYEGDGVVALGDVLRGAKDKLMGRGTVSVIVGSEGGFAPREVQAARDAGLIPVGLGKRILRTETASGFVLSCLVYVTELQG